MPAGQAKRLEWSALALAELRDQLEFIADDSPSNARAILRRIDEAAHLLAGHPELGTPGRLAGTREYPIARTSLTLIYRVRRDALQVARVLHQRRKYP